MHQSSSHKEMMSSYYGNCKYLSRWYFYMMYFDPITSYHCRTPTLSKCGGEAQHLEKLGFGVLRDSRMFRARQQGAKHLALGCSWCLGKVLKRRYRKWPCIGHLDICSPSYGQKKGRESNWQFDSRPLKIGNRPFPDVRFRSATWRWKDLNEGYNFGSDLVAIQLCSRELWQFKVPRVPLGQFRESQQNVPFGCSLSGELQRIL
jgi:hypothetical protein